MQCVNPECGRAFEPAARHPKQRYCSKHCFHHHNYSRNHEKLLAQNKERYHQNRDRYLRGRKKYQQESPVYRLGCYVRSAAKRGYVWGLTDEQAFEIMSMPCTYCGGAGGGIDRVDSSIGYIPENCAPCCSMCNYMKNNFSVGEFLSHAAKIVKHQSRLVLFSLRKQSVEKHG